MHGLREHIEHAYLTNAITAPGQQTGITDEGRGMAGHIKNPRRFSVRQQRDSLLCPGSRRIQQHQIVRCNELASSLELLRIKQIYLLELHAL